MKKHLSYWIVLLLGLLCSPVRAEVENCAGLNVAAGEWSMLPFSSTHQPSVGGAGSLGFTYEMRAGKAYSSTRFLLHTGLNLKGGLTNFGQSAAKDSVALMGQTDLDGDPFIYVYKLDGRQDKYVGGAVQVPLMIGVQHKRFYMLAGVKVNAYVFMRSITSTNVTTYGVYAAFPQGINILKDKPEYQFFNDIKVDAGKSMGLKLDLDGALEIGCRLGGIVAEESGYDVPRNKVEYRLAAFADFGILDFHTAGNSKPLVTPTTYDTDKSSKNYVYNTRSMVDGLEMNDVMSTTGFASSVHNLTVGIKFTVLFQLPDKLPCVICNDTFTRSRSARRTGMKYEE